jgi:hypothetical protein
MGAPGPRRCSSRSLLEYVDRPMPAGPKRPEVEAHARQPARVARWCMACSARFSRSRRAPSPGFFRVRRSDSLVSASVSVMRSSRGAKPPLGAPESRAPIHPWAQPGDTPGGGPARRRAWRARGPPVAFFNLDQCRMACGPPGAFFNLDQCQMACGPPGAFFNLDQCRTARGPPDGRCPTACRRARAEATSVSPAWWPSRWSRPPRRLPRPGLEARFSVYREPFNLLYARPGGRTDEASRCTVNLSTYSMPYSI